MAPCDVCDGTGGYPIHNRFGTHVCTIRCPICDGSGVEPSPDKPAEDDDRQHLPIPSTAPGA